MRWEKLGLIWTPTGERAWAKTHAAVPAAQIVDASHWRVYVGCRDGLGKSRVACVELKTNELPRSLPIVERVSDEPLLSLGEPGTFDDSGVMPSCLIRDGDKLRLYYIGWNVIGTVPYRVSIGLAVSDDGGRSFQRYSVGPVFDRSLDEPYFVTTPCVLRDGGIWRMWYTSCTGWKEINGRWEPSYHVKYAESPDGLRWKPSGISCIDYGEACSIARPCVVMHAGLYKMLYSYRSIVDYRSDRSNAYRFGYAESSDGIDWERMDDRVGIEKSAEGWDSEMLEYGWMQEHAGETYLLYNGNGFGRSGFGIARLAAWE